jgi:hypothetical protein
MDNVVPDAADKISNPAMTQNRIEQEFFVRDFDA